MNGNITVIEMLRRLPLGIKMLLATALIGITTWAGLDLWQTAYLKGLFRHHISNLVEENATANVAALDTLFRRYDQSLRLLATQDNLVNFVSRAAPAWSYPANIVNHTATPEWLPPVAVLRGFDQLRLVFLLDLQSRVHEVYYNQAGDSPTELTYPETMPLASLGHSSIMVLNQLPHLVATERIVVDNKPAAILMLATPIDDQFMVALQRVALIPYRITVAMIDRASNAVVASSNQLEVPRATPASSLEGRFIAASRDITGYAAPGVALEMTTLVQASEFATITDSILLTERQQRAITAFALIFASLVMVYWITHNIRKITRKIVEFSASNFGYRPRAVLESHRWDELHILNEQFHQLSTEVVTARDRLRAELLERLRTENELNKLYQAVEQSPVAVVITDTEHEIMYVNPQFTQLTGYMKEEALGRKQHFTESGDTPSHVFDAMWSTLEQGNAWRGQLRNRRKDGSTYWEMNTVSAIRTPQGVTTNYLIIREDVTLRLEMESATQQAKEAAEAANRIKSDFMANITHELRTPLNGITGFANLLMDGSFGELATTQRHHLRQLLDSANHLARLIDDLLDLSRVGTEQFILERSNFNLITLISNLEAAILPHARHKGLSFSTTIAPELPSELIGDPIRVRQILLNILGNAVKFTHRGRIELKVMRDQVATTANVRLLFIISDSGIGIPQDKLAIIFDPFTQGDSSTTREHGGSGVGLAIAKQLIELMGGQIWVESKVNHGSTFSFVIPFELAPARKSDFIPPQLVEPQDEDDTHDGLAVLVSGKNPINRLLLKMLLAKMRMDVSESSKCSKLSELLRARSGENRFQVIFLDCSDSSVPANNLVVSVRDLEGLERLPIILFGNEPEELDQMELPPLVYYLSKPIRRGQVHTLVTQALAEAMAHQITAHQTTAA